MRCESETDRARTGFQLAAQFAAGSFLLSGDTGRASAQISEELSAYLSAYLNAVRQRTSSPDVGRSLAAMYIWGPALAFLLAFTGIGAVLLPLLTAAYGFFPAYAVSCMAASFGRQGVLMAAVFFGLRCLITFPCFFLLAVPSWEAAVVRFRASFGRGYPVQADSRRCWLRLIGVCLTLCLGIWLDLRLSPVLLQALLERIF